MRSSSKSHSPAQASSSGTGSCCTFTALASSSRSQVAVPPRPVSAAFPAAPAPSALAQMAAGADPAGGQRDLQRAGGLVVQPKEPPLGIQKRVQVCISPLAVGHAQDLGD